jgi:acyl-CoA thioesterase-1
LVLLGLLAASACREPSAEEQVGAPSYGARRTELQGASRDPEPQAFYSGPLVVFLGDSLTAGLGLGEEEAFPARVASSFAAAGRPIRVVNAGVSGDTSAGGLARLDWLLRQRPDVLVVELGANDGLRGLPVEMTAANLRAIVSRARQAGVRVLLVGIQVPPNYGPDYARRFAAVFPELARELDVPLLPFLLEGVAGVPQLNLPDGIHPTAEGHERLARNVMPYLEQVLTDEPGA